MMDDHKLNRIRPDSWRMTVGLMGVAFLLYQITLVRFPQVGASASFLGNHLGIFPFWEPQYPLWRAMVRSLAVIWPSQMVVLIHTMQSLLMAVVLGLLYRLHVRHHLLRARHDDLGSETNLVRGLIVFCFLLVSTASWVMATRAYPWVVGAFLLVLSFALLSEYHRHGSRRCLYGFSFIFGLCLIEYSSALLFVFPLIVVSLVALIRRRDFSSACLLKMAACSLVGMVAVIGLCWWMARGAVLVPGNNFPETHQLFRDLLGKNFRSLLSLPKTGWLLILVVSLLPWFLALMLSGVDNSNMTSSSVRLMNSFVVVLCLVGLYNTPISPWAVTGFWRPLFLPDVLLASAYGTALAYWFHVLRSPPEGDRTRRRRRRKTRPRVAIGLVAVAFFALVGACVVNVRYVEASTSKPLYEIARQMARDAEGLEFLVTQGEGELNTLINIAALSEGHSVLCLSPGLQRVEAYSHYVREQFREPRLRGLAKVGIVPVLRDILMNDPERAEQIGLEAVSELWGAHGYTMIPVSGFCRGVKDRDSVDVRELAAKQFPFWEAMKTNTDSGSAIRSLLLLKYKARLSRLANEFGQLCELREEEELAIESYEAALAIVSENFPARLNLYSLRQERGDVSVDWNELAESYSRMQLDLSTQVRVFGRVMRESSVSLLEKVLSVEDVEASSTSAEDEALLERFNGVKELLAVGAYQEGEDELKAIISENPDFLPAWMIRGLIAYEQRNQEVWEKCWKKMTQIGAEWLPFLEIQAQWKVAQGEIEEARELYFKALRKAPTSMKILDPLLRLEFLHGSNELREPLVRTALDLDPNHALANFVLGTMQVHRGEILEAEASLRVAYEQEPSAMAINNLAWVLIERGKYEEALDLAEEGLNSVDTMFALWDTRGMALFELGLMEEAEQSYRRAMELEPRHPTVKLHLAETFLLQDRVEEAKTMMDEVDRDEFPIPETELSLYEEIRTQLGLEDQQGEELPNDQAIQ